MILPFDDSPAHPSVTENTNYVKVIVVHLFSCLITRCTSLICVCCYWARKERTLNGDLV